MSHDVCNPIHVSHDVSIPMSIPIQSVPIPMSIQDSCASVKSQLEALGDTDVVAGQEKPELQSIIVSCDEL